MAIVIRGDTTEGMERTSLPQHGALAAVMRALPAALGVETADQQASIDELITAYLTEHHLSGVVISAARWDRVTLQVDQPPVAQVLRYHTSAIAQMLRQAGHDVTLTVRVNRR